MDLKPMPKMLCYSHLDRIKDKYYKMVDRRHNKGLNTLYTKGNKCLVLCYHLRWFQCQQHAPLHYWPIYPLSFTCT